MGDNHANGLSHEPAPAARAVRARAAACFVFLFAQQKMAILFWSAENGNAIRQAQRLARMVILTKWSPVQSSTDIGVHKGAKKPFLKMSHAATPQIELMAGNVEEGIRNQQRKNLSQPQ